MERTGSCACQVRPQRGQVPAPTGPAAAQRLLEPRCCRTHLRRVLRLAWLWKTTRIVHSSILDSAVCSQSLRPFGMRSGSSIQPSANHTAAWFPHCRPIRNHTVADRHRVWLLDGGIASPRDRTPLNGTAPVGTGAVQPNPWEDSVQTFTTATWPPSPRRHRDTDRNPSRSRRCPTLPMLVSSKCAWLLVSCQVPEGVYFN